MTDRGWPVYDPGAGGLGDLYPYVEFELEYEVTDADIEPDPFADPEDPTVVMPAARLVERCTTSVALGRSK